MLQLRKTLFLEEDLKKLIRISIFSCTTPSPHLSTRLIKLAALQSQNTLLFSTGAKTTEQTTSTKVTIYISNKIYEEMHPTLNLISQFSKAVSTACVKKKKLQKPVVIPGGGGRGCLNHVSSKIVTKSIAGVGRRAR